MPNWCCNTVTVFHEDPAQILRFYNAAKEGKLFYEFVPLNENGDWEYGKAVDMWGTKWDIEKTEFSVSEQNDCAEGQFNTAWAPPIAFYKAMIEMGFEIEAMYHEGEMQFAGTFKDGVDKSCEYDFTNPNWREEIDDEDILGIVSDAYEFWLQCQEDEDEDEGQNE